MGALLNQIAETEELWIELDGYRMRYLRAGSGPALLLIHGLLGYSFSWRFNIAALSRVSTVYAIDLLGTGYSDRPRNLACDLRSSADRLLRFLSAVDAGPATVLGTSQGGGIAVNMAALDQERGGKQVQRLILSAPINPWSQAERYLTGILGSQWGAALLRSCYPFAVKHTGNLWLRRMYGDPRRIPPGTLAGYTDPVMIPGTIDYGLTIVSSWGSDMKALRNTYEQLADFSTLLLWGSRDRVVLLRSAAEIQKRMRASSLRMIGGAGHLPYEEFPEEFNRLVIDFLTSS